MATMSESTKPAAKAGGGASELDRTVSALSETVRSYLGSVFTKHAHRETNTWTKDTIRTFLTHTQKQHASPPFEAYLSKDELDLDGFVAWMTSSNGAVSMPPQGEDLTWPLASYFVSSSHNTYLTGHQLYSDSSTRPYTDTLLRGGRCIEIDVWDGDESDLDTSDSSSDDDVVKAVRAQQQQQQQQPKKKMKKKRSKLSLLKEKLPGAVASKLDKTAIGKKIEERDAQKAAASETSTATATATASKTATAGAETARAPKETPKEAPKEAPKEPVLPTDEAEQPAEPEVPMIEPRVLHGYTLTKEIPFRAVCQSIRDSAFVVSNLPVIVSLEVHCSPEQQLAMVRIMRDVWDGLLVPDVEADVDVLPSPNDLRGKILIKVKYAPPGSSPPVGDTAVDESDDDDERMSGDKKAKAKPSKIIQELSLMGVYMRGVSFKSLEQPEAAMPAHIFSLSEKKAIDVHDKQGLDLFEHNRRFWMRTYPSGLRIGSSNLDPCLFWRKGIQIVALNWQNWDEGMMLNEGMFAGTGGYVLKPEGYRPNLDAKASSPNTIVRKTLNLAVTFLAAQNIPLPAGDSSPSGFNPYVKVELHVEGPNEMHGGPIVNNGHEREGEYKVRTKTLNGVDVDFASERLEFPPVPAIVDELSWVRFTVRDDEFGRDDLSAWACVRLDRLGHGYRFVHLLDCEGRLTSGVILIKVEKAMM